MGNWRERRCRWLSSRFSVRSKTLKRKSEKHGIERRASVPTKTTGIDLLGKGITIRRISEEFGISPQEAMANPQIAQGVKKDIWGYDDIRKVFEENIKKEA